MAQFDVVVIGGGVAGAATAVSLRNHAPHLTIVIVERGAYNTSKIGETLPPQTAVSLRQLGLWTAFLQQQPLPAHGTKSAWGSETIYENEFVYSAYGRGWHLDRQAFDQWLANEAVARGATLWTHTRLHHQQRTSDGWQLTLQNGAGQQQVSCRFVVDATGRLALFGRQQGAKRVFADQLVGLFCFATPKRPFRDSYVLLETAVYGWWYSALLPNGSVATALMTDADLVAEIDWGAALCQTRYTRDRLEDIAKTAVPRPTAAHSQRLDPLVGDGWLAVGDAASTYDPLSSQGIFKALRTAVLAAYAISDTLQGKPNGLAKYEALIKAEYRAYLQTRRDYYRQEQRWSQAPFWQRRQEQTSFP